MFKKGQCPNVNRNKIQTTHSLKTKDKTSISKKLQVAAFDENLRLISTLLLKVARSFLGLVWVMVNTLDVWERGGKDEVIVK